MDISNVVVTWPQSMWGGEYRSLLEFVGAAPPGPLLAKVPALTPLIIEHCGKLVPAPKVVPVPSRPFKNALPMRCWANTQAMVSLFGGHLVTGWALWADEYILFGEYHGLWARPDGEWRCVSPQLGGDAEIQFLAEREWTEGFPGQSTLAAGGCHYFPLRRASRVALAAAYRQRALVCGRRPGHPLFQEYNCRADDLIDSQRKVDAARATGRNKRRKSGR